jgi:sigma-B regulation protein RsbU (phosphoserine phosphatase)
VNRAPLPSGHRPSPVAAIRAWAAGTFAGRLIAAGVAIKLVTLALGALFAGSRALAALDTAGAAALLLGAALLAYQLSVSVRQRVLWRVRRKLVLSYVFIGFVPALLIAAFFLLSGLLLFFNIGAYLVRSRIGALVDQTQFFAQSAALEMQRARTPAAIADALGHRQGAAAARFPATSFALIPAPRCGGAPAVKDAIAAGPWTHLDAPRDLPAWVPCAGWAGLVTYEVDGATSFAARAVAWTEGPAHAVVVDVPLSAAIVREMAEQTGVLLGGVSTFDAAEAAGGPADPAGGTPRLPPAAAETGRQLGIGDRFGWVAFLDYTDWPSGRADRLTVGFRLGLLAVYERISIVSVSRDPGQNFAQILLLLLAVVGALFLVIQAVAFGMGFALARSITGSVHALFVGTERVRRGDFSHRIAIRSRDQLGELAESFNLMTASIEDLLREKAVKERLEQELAVARSIQMSLLPSGPMSLPGLSLTAHCEPAREVGGDYYDVLPIDDRTVGILVADVSGKGPSAALYMAELKGIVLSLSHFHLSPRDLLVEADQIISRHLDPGSFITVSYLLLDLRARTLRYARAGHCPLIYVPGPYAASRAPRILMPGGLVLGLQLDGGRTFTRLLEEVTLPLGAGDWFLLYTDGISEAMNEDGDCFGDERLADLVAAHADLSADALRARILEQVGAFSGGAQHDDMTMVLLRIDDDPPGGDP